MRVHVLSKRLFDKLMLDNNITDENVEKFDSIMFISIVDTDNEFNSVDHYFKKNHENVINLKFDDVENDGESSPTNVGDTRAFSEDQAERLYRFIKKHREKETCIVHCMAGLSRSPGVGQFIVDFTKSDQEQFKRDNRYMMPNARVFRMIKNEWFNDLT